MIYRNGVTFFILLTISLITSACLVEQDSPSIPLAHEEDPSYFISKHNIIYAARDVNYTDRNGNTLLMHAAWQGNKELVKGLLEEGALVNETNAKRETALMFACQKGHTAIAQLLLKAGACIYAYDSQKKTALHKAQEQRKTEIVKLLTNWQQRQDD